IVAGLDMDFKGNPFGPMPALMATAEYVTKVHAVCTKTGNLAQYSFRKSPDDSLVVLGEKEAYEPLSRAAFFKLNNQKSAVNNIHPPKKNKK
ncbi:thymidine kinase, partial [Flavobacteriaceae bacterium]|nr:thymidine kinase [Flavobacteriaceae bacterium]